MLTNKAPAELTSLLRETANLREDEYSGPDRSAVGARIAQVSALLESRNDEHVGELSAELKGLLAIDALEPGCMHYLLHTDTFQGAEAASLVSQWMRQRGCASTFLQRLEHLTTRNQSSFARGIDSLLTWCDATLPELRRQGYYITFNLVGGFKSLQAYAQTIGMIYADEITYIFEGPGSELIRIPRLPISFDTDALERHSAVIARMAEAYETIAVSELSDLPEAYLDIDGDIAALSTWGKLAWNQHKHRILTGQLLEQTGLRYEARFVRDFESCGNRELREALQLTLAKAAALWNEGGLQKLRGDGGLQYSDLSGGIGHFRINRGDRVSCIPEDSTLVLRRFGSHDDVIRNP
jgi:putative CRISPR-associated protein (TIGR02619 family)